jgi:hypothetical protein
MMELEICAESLSKNRRKKYRMQSEERKSIAEAGSWVTK